MNHMPKSAGLAVVIAMCIVSLLPLGCTSEAAFEVRSLDVTPSETNAGDEAIVTAVVRNDGGAAGTYEAILTVDGDEVAKESLLIEAETSKTVTFSLTQDVAGTYEVGLGDMRATLVVVEEPTPAPEEEPDLEQSQQTFSGAESAEIEISIDSEGKPVYEDGGWHWRVAVNETNGVGITLTWLDFEYYDDETAVPVTSFNPAEQHLLPGYLGPNEGCSFGASLICGPGVTDRVGYRLIGVDDNGHQIVAEAVLDLV